MPNLNRVMLMGNLTRDPELRFTPNNNTAVAQIGLAINHQWKDPQGEKKEEVTFIDCEAWGKTAEVLNQYLKKGKPVYVEGRLKLDQWEDKDGNKRSKLKVVIESFQFIDSKGEQGGTEPTQPRQQQKPAPQSSTAKPSNRVEFTPPPPEDDENFPF